MPLDTTPPTTSATQLPTVNANGWNNTDVAVALSATDNAGGSGLKEIRFTLSGAQTGDGLIGGSSTSMTISAEGITALTYFAVDNAGNQETPKTLTVRIDKTPPLPPTASVTPAPNAAGWNNDPSVTVTFAGNGDTGAVLGSPVACTGPTTLSSETAGIVVKGTCTDAAGNSSTETSVTVKIDRTPPTVRCGVTPAMLWPPDHKLTPVSVTVGVTDSLSGPAGFTLRSVTSSEPGTAPGNTTGDIQGFVTGTASTAGQLRAERSGTGSGRVYTLTYQGMDVAGNAAICSTTVTVPHDQRR